MNLSSRLKRHNRNSDDHFFSKRRLNLGANQTGTFQVPILAFSMARTAQRAASSPIFSGNASGHYSNRGYYRRMGSRCSVGSHGRVRSNCTSMYWYCGICGGNSCVELSNASFLPGYCYNNGVNTSARNLTGYPLSWIKV